MTRDMPMETHISTTSLERVLQAPEKTNVHAANWSVSLPQAVDPRIRHCRACGGVGWYVVAVPVHHPDFGRLQRCVCGQEVDAEAKQKQDQDTAARVIACLGDELGALATCTLDRFDVNRRLKPFDWNENVVSVAQQRHCLRSALDIARRWSTSPPQDADGRDHWLYLYGPVGSGKSHLAAGIANAWAARGANVHYRSLPNLIDGLRRFKDDIAYQLMRTVTTADLLVLDDFDAQYDTDPYSSRQSFVREKLYRIVHERVGCTVITSNTHPDDIDEAEPKRITTRLIGYCEIVPMPIYDMRRMERTHA